MEYVTDGNFNSEDEGKKRWRRPKEERQMTPTGRCAGKEDR